MTADDEGEFLFVGEKNGAIKIWNVTEEGDTLKSSIDIGTSLFDLSFENRYFSVVSIASGKGLLIRDIKSGKDIYTFQPEPHVSCISLAWDISSNFSSLKLIGTYLFAGFSDGVIRVFRFKDNK